MYKVLLLIKNNDLLKNIKKRTLWDKNEEFELTCCDGRSKISEEIFETNNFDLLIMEDVYLDEFDVFYLKEIRRKMGDTKFALCGQKGTFEYAKAGIKIGVDEYFVQPFNEKEFESVFLNIKNERNVVAARSVLHIKKVIELFENNDNDFIKYIESQKNINLLKGIYTQVFSMVFSKYEWLDLYVSSDELVYTDVENIKRSLCDLFKIFHMLYPPHNEKIHNVIQYILYNPESDLRQKNISKSLYINSSYLSTIFTAQADFRFVDYITNVKMCRGAWLLKNTAMKVSTIGQRLGYSDIGYFSRQFKKQFGFTPSQYRIPDSYEFNI